MKDIELSTDKNIAPHEIVQLFESVGWHGTMSDAVATSINLYPLVITARSLQGQLVGYTTIFSDGVLSTFIGEIVVHPYFQRCGVARSMIEEIARHYPNVPITVHALGDSKVFFEEVGFRRPSADMTVMFRR